MNDFLLPLFLILPLLLAGYQWYKEEYLFTGKNLSYWQYFLLSCFFCYSAYCLFSGVDSIILQLVDQGYKAGRALSFSGMWSFVMPGLIAPLIIFPRETLLYLFRQPTARNIETAALATLGWILLLFTLGRYLLVI
jgi:hypothetical protein